MHQPTSAPKVHLLEDETILMDDFNADQASIGYPQMTLAELNQAEHILLTQAERWQREARETSSGSIEYDRHLDSITNLIAPELAEIHDCQKQLKARSP